MYACSNTGVYQFYHVLYVLQILQRKASFYKISSLLLLGISENYFQQIQEDVISIIYTYVTIAVHVNKWQVILLENRKTL